MLFRSRRTAAKPESGDENPNRGRHLRRHDLGQGTKTRPIRRSANTKRQPPLVVAGKEEEGGRTNHSLSTPNPSQIRHRGRLILPYLHAGRRETGSRPPHAAGASGGGQDPRPRRRRKRIGDGSPFSPSKSPESTVEGEGIRTLKLFVLCE